ncbi:MAG TPA: hypothetical protein VKG79_04870, partial [Bryobacteraceae bacterium]|nr:hypothetical protein [Bryobacteraceae bacterium]
TINRVAATETDVALRMNGHAEFWRISSMSLQTALFIVLARILDSNDNVHSIHQVLNATMAHPEFFQGAAIRARKLALPGLPWAPGLLDECIQRAWEPTAQDLRLLKKLLAPHTAKFDAIYRPIRNQIAHIILKDESLILGLYNRTQKDDIDELLCCLHTLVHAIREMWINGRHPELSGDNYGYARRVAEIDHATERLLREIP